MNLRWLYGNFADPQYKLPLREQVRLSNQAHKHHVSTAAFLVRTALILLPMAVMVPLLPLLLALMGYGGSTSAHTYALLALLALFWPWSAWMYRFLYIVPIRKAMRANGFDLCLQCGYEWRGLPPDIKRCPECGAEREAMP